MPVPVDPPDAPGLLRMVGTTEFALAPGTYVSAGYLAGYDKTTAHWHIYGAQGNRRESSIDGRHTPDEGVAVRQVLSVYDGTGDDTIVLHWNARTAYLPWNIDPADMQNNIDTLIAGIHFDPLSPDEETPNNCTVTGTAGNEYEIVYLNEYASAVPALGLDYQPSPGSSGRATLSTGQSVDGREELLDTFQVRLRNTDTVFESYGFQPWTKVYTGVRDTHVKTKDGWVPISRLPERFSVKSHRYINNDNRWFRLAVAGRGDYRYLNTETMRTFSDDGHLLDIGDFVATDGNLSWFDGQFHPAPDITGPVIFPTSWPTRDDGAGSRIQGGNLSGGFTQTFDGSDPVGLAATENALSSVGSNWRKAWTYVDDGGIFTTGHYDLINERSYSYTALMVDDDWVLWLKDRVCQSGATAYIYVQVSYAASIGVVGGAGSEVDVDLPGYQLYISSCTPAVTTDVVTQLSYDGTLPVTDIYASGVPGSLRVAVPIEGDIIYTSKVQPHDTTTSFNTTAYAFRITPTAGGVSGLYFNTDAIPDGLVSDPDLDPHLDNAHLPVTAAGISGSIIKAGITFSQPGEPVNEWQYIRWQSEDPDSTEWLLGPVTIVS